MRWHVAAAGIYSGSGVSPPAAAHTRVFASSGNVLGAYKPSTGARVWAFGLGSDADLGAPAFANGVVYVGSTDGKVYAVDASTGFEMWTVSIGPRFRVGVSVETGVVYATSDKVYALNARSGAVLWSGSTGKKGAGGWPPAIANGMVYVQGFNARLYAFGLF